MAYKYQEFPRVVYGPNGETVTITSEAERPDGYRNHPKEFLVSAEENAKAAEDAAKKAEKAEKDAILHYLSQNNVKLPHPNTGIDKLRALKKQLDEHLAAQVDDDGE